MGYYINKASTSIALSAAVAMVSVNAYDHSTGEVKTIQISEEQYYKLLDEAHKQEKERYDKLREYAIQLAVRADGYYRDELIVQACVHTFETTRTETTCAPSPVRRIRRFLFYGSYCKGHGCIPCIL